MKKVNLLSMALAAAILAGCGTGAVDNGNSTTGASDDVVVTSEDRLADTASSTEESAAESEGDYDIVLPDGAPVLDVDGLETLDQIVENKVTEGMGYATIKLCGTDVLLVSSGCFDNEGKNAAIDSSAYMVGKEGKVVELGGFDCGGTAYPVIATDSFLYIATSDSVAKFTLKDEDLSIVLIARNQYDEDGSESYFINDGSGEVEVDSDTVITSLYDEMFAVSPVEYTVK